MSRRLFLKGLVGGFSAALLLGAVWSTFEAVPIGTDLASSLDTFITKFKSEVRERMEVEHIFGQNTDDNGLHTLGSARCFVQNGAPTDISGGTATRGQYNNSAETDGGTLLTTEELGVSTADLGAGRCWFDADGADGLVGTTDDFTLNVWDETLGGPGGWRAAPAQAADGAGIGANNLIYNGSFEVTDGTGAIPGAGACTSGTPCPAGWVQFGATTPTVHYDDPTAVTEGEGIAFETLGSGAVDEGVQQTLTSLKANVDYVFRARARPVGAGDTCSLRVTGGDVTPTIDQSAAATNVFETLEVVVNTTGAPAALIVVLESDADGDECDWDHVVAFERNAVVAQPGYQVCRVTDASTGASYYTTGAWASVGTTCVVTPPAPGYVVRVTGFVQADEDVGANDASFMVRLQENSVSVATGAMGYRILTTPSVNVGFVRVNPTPGTTLSYTMDGRINAGVGALDRNIDDAAELQGETVASWIQVELIPTR